MRISISADLTALVQGARFLWQRPLWALSLAGLAMLLSALGAYLHVKSALPNDLLFEASLSVVATLPLEIYFLPRFLMAIDAETLDHPGNPKEHWRDHFEVRWLRTCGAKVLLYLAVFAGATCFLLPGLFLLAAFGWAPLRVLLRGESIRDAARGSVTLMSRLWPRVVFTSCTIVIVYMGIAALIVAGLTHKLPEPTPWIRLTHPSMWAANFAVGLLSLWVSASFLALYHRIELYDSVPDSSSK